MKYMLCVGGLSSPHSPLTNLYDSHK